MNKFLLFFTAGILVGCQGGWKSSPSEESMTKDISECQRYQGGCTTDNLADAERDCIGKTSEFDSVYLSQHAVIPYRVDYEREGDTLIDGVLYYFVYDKQNE